MRKLKIEYRHKAKRNPNIITPCCNKSNKDGKFATYHDLPEIYGYCHSCGKQSLPPSIYLDELGSKHIWNDQAKKYEPIDFTRQNTTIIKQKHSKNGSKTNTISRQKFIAEDIIWQYNSNKPENNLIKYLRKTYNVKRVNEVITDYILGNTKDGAICFWQINKQNLVQKVKIMYYNSNGKRHGKTIQPYTNPNGYYSCLFGEHLILDKFKGKQKLILVESEKTAIVGAILLPEFTWLAYGGSNGLTKSKYNSLIGHNVLIIPDMSVKDVQITQNKIIELNKIGVSANIWDMTNGRSDEQLKIDGDYNCDLEDVFRRL